MKYRNVFLVLTLVLTGAVILTQSLYADDVSEAILKLLVNKGIITQREVDDMKAEIAGKKPPVPETVEERVGVLEEKVGEKGFLSAKGVDFQLGGELELEFVDTGSDGDEPDPHFQLDKFVLHPKVKIGENFKSDAQIYVKETKAYLNEIHAKFINLFLNTWIDAGLYERWAKSQYKRKLEAYPLVGTAFWRDDALTVTWGGELGPLYGMLSVGNGYELGDKQVSEDKGRTIGTTKGNYILHDDHATSDLSDSMEYGINLGFKHELFGGEIDILGFYYLDELSGDDIKFLQKQITNYTSNSDDKDRLGISLRYDLGGLRLAGQYITAEDGELDRDGWVVETGYHFKFGDRKWLTGVMPIVSYGELDVDSSYDQSPTDPLSWDRQKTMLGLIVDLYKLTKLKLEYYLNSEDTGNSNVSNDEFLAQLEIKF